MSHDGGASRSWRRAFRLRAQRFGGLAVALAEAVGPACAVTALLLAGAQGFSAVVSADAPKDANADAAQVAKVDAKGAVDIASVEIGGRIESTTSVNVAADWIAANLIASTRYSGWRADNPDVPQEIVFSFFNQQPALVAGVAINPKPKDEPGAAKDVEVWTSAQSPTAGFVKVATATLAEESVEQLITFAPVEARFLMLRLLSAHERLVNGEPAPVPVALARVRIYEGERPGYVSILTRNPELGALAKGIIPQAPASAMGPPLPAEGPACTASVAPPRKPSFAQSRNALVIGDWGGYAPARWKPTDLNDTLDTSVIGKVVFKQITAEVAAPSHLLSAPVPDTVILAQVCEIDEIVSKDFKQALMAWVAAGHKLIIQDSDACAADPATRSPRRSPDYSFLPYQFRTSNPGALGAKGEASLLENSTLGSTSPSDPRFLDMAAWAEGGNDLGDANVVVEYDAHWCGGIWARNAPGRSGFALAYTRYGRGLIIYDGFDFEGANGAEQSRLLTQELKQPFDPDGLPCTQPLGSFIITAGAELKSQPMVAGRTYSYPLSILGNFGYSGRVTLEAKLVPADPNIAVKLDTTVADLTAVDKAVAALTVAAGPSASLSSKVLEVRGNDANGKSNVLCLALPERRTGGLTVSSGLRKDKAPTKNLEIILDASGSMKLSLGKKTRWATALDVLADVVAKLPADYSVGLRTYGHREASTSPKTCTDTELVSPVAPLDRAQIINASKQLKPRGETPLVYSILQTPDDLKEMGGGTVILITDGEESCKGDFAAAARTLKDSGLNLTLNIVGFTLKAPKATADLGGLAESTGGHYYGAQSGAALARAVLLAAVDQLPYRILDAKGTEVDKGIAGVDGKHELPPGDYRVVVNAGEESLTVPVTLALRQDVSIKVGIKDDQLVWER